MRTLRQVAGSLGMRCRRKIVWVENVENHRKVIGSDEEFRIKEVIASLSLSSFMLFPFTYCHGTYFLQCLAGSDCNELVKVG